MPSLGSLRDTERGGERLPALLSAFLLFSLVMPAASAHSASDAGAAPSDPVRLLAANEREVRLEVATPPVSLVASTDANGVVCVRPQIAGFIGSVEPGHPQLPVKVVLLGVPAGADLSLEVATSPTRSLPAATPCVAAPSPMHGADTPRRPLVASLWLTRRTPVCLQQTPV